MRNLNGLLSVGLVLAVLAPCPTWAQKPKPPGGSPGGYTLVDLVSPYHALDGNWSNTEAKRVSRRATATGPLYIIGSYQRDASGPNALPCLWTVSPSGNVSVVDLSPGLSLADAVNSSGIVGGRGQDNLPSIRMPGGLVISLPTPGGTEGGVTAITEISGAPGALTFQVIGNQGVTSDADASSTLWVLSQSGTLLDTIPLRDPFGINLYATDINAEHRLAGSIYPAGSSSTVTAELAGGVLAIDPLVLAYSKFVYLWEAYINDSGDVMAKAGEPVPGGIGVYRRTFVWPASGGMVNLSDLNGGNSAAGEAIATVGGQLQVVGEAFSNNGWHGFLYSAGQLRNLNTLTSASAWNLFHGRGISNDGHIVGLGRISVRRNSQYHGFLLLKP